MVFNGSDASEKFDISANGSRVRLTRDVGGVTLDLNGIETIDLNALGGADTITVNDQAQPTCLPSTWTSTALAATATGSPTPSSSTEPTKTTSSRSRHLTTERPSTSGACIPR